MTSFYFENDPKEVCMSRKRFVTGIIIYLVNGFLSVIFFMILLLLLFR